MGVSEKAESGALSERRKRGLARAPARAYGALRMAEELRAVTALNILAALYFVPSIVAGMRSHRQLAPIIALNVLLGWTLVGWIAALVWSLAAREAQVRPSDG